MRVNTKKYLVAGAVLLSAVTYLAFAGMKEGWFNYHMPVDEFMANPKYHAQRVRLAGTVAEEGVSIGQARLGVQFSLQGDNSSIPVVYGGLLPDLFKPGSEVIVEGRFDGTTFRAQSLLTKCASKYENADHARPQERAS
jgi:cytochrome c-type biogenesis protein CcmE